MQQRAQLMSFLKTLKLQPNQAVTKVKTPSGKVATSIKLSVDKQGNPIKIGINAGWASWSINPTTAVSYTHLTLPTKRIV